MRLLVQTLALLYACLSLGFFSGCTTQRTITAVGLKYIQLGEEMPTPDNQQFRAGPYRDTLLVEDGYEWPAKIIQYPQGDVWIEADFFGADLVNRIRVESPTLSIKGNKKLHVGTSLSVLLSQHNRWQVSYLADYARYDVIDPLQQGIHYLFVAPDAVSTPPTLSDLPPNATIQAIVVM